MRAGLDCRTLAAEAGIAGSTLSEYFSGLLSSPGTQFDIWRAFIRLTQSDVTLEGFWGDLSWRKPHG